MLSNEEAYIDRASESKDFDASTCFVEAVYAYLQELDGFRTVCRRHEETAAVYVRGDRLQVTRFFQESDEMATHLDAAIQRLATWDDDARWQGAEWRRIGARTGGTVASRNAVVWAGLPVVVDVRHLATSALLQIDVILPPRDGDFPELPLRTLAVALECHEFLVPEVFGTALPPPAGRELPLLRISEHLKRVTPQNMVASQCI